MSDTLNFKGLAKFSFRLWLLRRLLTDDDTMVSSLARRLLMNKTARRLGAIFEILVIYLTPILSLIRLLFYYFGFFPSFAGSTIPSSSSMLILQIFSYIVSGIGLVSLLVAIFMAVYPVLDLVNRDADGNTLRFVTLHENEILMKLLRIQLASFLLPWVLGSILSLFVSIVESFINSGPMGQAGSVFAGVFGLVMSTVMTAVMAIAAIRFAMTSRTFWGAVIGTLLYYIFAYIVIFTPVTAFIFATTAPGGNSEIFWIIGLGVIAVMAGSAIAMGVTWFFARGAIRKAIQPSK